MNKSFRNFAVVGLLMSVCAFQRALAQEGGGTGPDWQTIQGTWVVESAERDETEVEQLVGLRYFFEPGLVRWANPDVKSEVTGMPIMMGRLLKHVDANDFQMDAIYPPAASGKAEIAVDGEAMVVIARAQPGAPALTLTLSRKHGRSPKPPREKMIGLAKDAYKEGELSKAYQFAQLQLINFPDDREATILLAHSRLQKGIDQKSGFNPDDLRLTITQANWALDKHPDAHALRHKFGAFLYRFMSFQEAIKQFQALQDAEQFEKDSMLKHAQALGRLNKREEAKKILEDMIGYDSGAGEFTGRERIRESNGGYLFLANAMAAEGKTEEGTKIVDELVKRYPDAPKSLLDRGRYLLSQGKRDEALKEFEAALKMAPDDRETMLVNIEVNLRDEDEEVDTLIDRALEIHGRETVLVVLAASRAGLKRDFERGLAIIDEGLKEQPTNQSLLSIKIQLLAEMGDYDAAEAIIKELPKLGTPPAAAALMQAKVYISSNQFSKATRTLATMNLKGMPPAFANQVTQVKALLKRKMDAAANQSISEDSDAESGSDTEQGSGSASNEGSGTSEGSGSR